MPKVAILYIALGRYTVFWKEFYESVEKYLSPCDKHYYIWTDNFPEQIAYSDNENITIIPTKKRGWPYDSLMRFQMFADIGAELEKYDYVFFFNANMMFVNPTDLSEIAPQSWHDGLVAGVHPGAFRMTVNNPDRHSYERRPESTAYIPYGAGKDYVCGAFNGGTGSAFVKMARTLAQNVQTDLDNNIVAGVDDESHLNAYVHDKKFLLAGVAYGLHESDYNKLRKSRKSIVKIISRTKDSPKYGGTRYLRGATDKKIPNNFTTPIMKTLFRIATLFVPNGKTRKKIRSYYG